MKVHRDVEQLSTDWFLLRHGKIGGSRSKGLTVKTDTLLFELIAEAIEPFDEFQESYVSDDMLRGTTLEPQARFELGKYTGYDFGEAGWIQSEVELLGISPDGITSDNKVTCEIKCPGAKRHIETCLDNEIPIENIHQCIHYFTVNPGLEKHFFLSYRPEFTIKPMFVKELTWDNEVNIGTRARPVMKTIRDVVEMKLIAAKKIQQQVKKKIEQIKF